MTILQRNQYLHSKLDKYAGQSFYCPALSANVKVLKKSIDETCFHAARSQTSMNIALQLPYIIENAKIYLRNRPTHNNKQSKEFGFDSISILLCQIQNIGIAKLVVGKRKNNNYYEYSITEWNIFTAC